MKGINWHSGHICAEHWSRGYRENASTYLPDIPAQASQLEEFTRRTSQVRVASQVRVTSQVRVRSQIFF